MQYNGTAKAGVYFGLFLTELRRSGYEIPLSDKATAELLRDGLDLMEPEDDDGSTTNESMSAAMTHMAELVASDNGTDGTGEADDDE